MAKTRTEIQAKYDASHRKTYSLKLHNESDADIIEKLSSVPSMQGYIKQLIRQDLSSTCSVSVPFCEATLSVLSEIAAQQNTTVPELIAMIVNNDIVRTFRQNTKG